MTFTEYDALIKRSNEINALKRQLNNMIDRGKNTIIIRGRRTNIADRIKQLNFEHAKIIRKINEAHDIRNR
jgi:phosphotransacetylase